MKEEKEEAHNILDKYYIIATELNENATIESRRTFSKQCAKIHIEGIISGLSKVQESQDLSMDSVRCVTKEIRLQIEVLNQLDKLNQ